ncbi:hypothetical protein [Corynebacterium variabile]|uniref:hypothetical protein n=1 Tax=Corynebacterium variabile TaxID=1727 RepID=UPI00289D0222|nr:hypothetical protein [Corynebacterium variabile]
MTSPGDNTRFSFGRPQWDMDRAELEAASTEVGDKVASKQDLESLLPMSGFCRLAGTGTNVEHLANKFLPFNVQKGPALGCEIHAEDGIVLNAIGMWEVKVRVLSAVSTLPAVAGYAVTRLETFDPDGNMVSREVGKVAGSGVTGGYGQASITVSDNIVVDRPGYRTRVYVLTTGGVITANWRQEEGTSLLSAQYVYNGTINLGGA